MLFFINTILLREKINSIRKKTPSRVTIHLTTLKPHTSLSEKISESRRKPCQRLAVLEKNE